MWLLWELLKKENLEELARRKLIDLKSLKWLAEHKTISWETFEEIDKIIREKKAVEI